MTARTVLQLTASFRHSLGVIKEVPRAALWLQLYHKVIRFLSLKEASPIAHPSVLNFNGFSKLMQEDDEPSAIGADDLSLPWRTLMHCELWMDPLLSPHRGPILRPL
ncbi:hypothetical protein TIFTF001_044606 [Ficus carica]|uniref:Uncharacterized protein n=1 Tax=Ficus carica TaxID=3494 RepID=A0AA88CVA8_FICCA|nr:hypothetical protein TIFTF001_044606 [Ficus carica]